MILAAIDIGSNGIRFQVIRVIKFGEKTNFKKLEYIRFPLRLGKSVFTTGEIDKESTDRLVQLMKCFALLMDLYQIQEYIAVATSAMRESSNSGKVLDRVYKEAGIHIRLISGTEEAELLGKAIIPFLDERSYAHIDVGGGSTEINIYHQQKKVDSKSFQIGTVRGMEVKKQLSDFQVLNDWIQTLHANLPTPILGVGTGGNIHKLYKLSNQSNDSIISLTELKGMRAYISQFSFEEKQSALNMNPDRADVIETAADIYINVMEALGADKMLVPGVGLKDGLLYKLYEETTKIPLHDVQFVGGY